MILKTVFVLIIGMAILSGPTFAQDDNQPDSLFIGQLKIERGGTGSIEINFFNDQELAALTIPLQLIGEGFRIDSISFAGSRVEYLKTRPITIGKEGRHVVFGAICMLEEYIQPGKGLMATLYVRALESAKSSSCTIDTTTIGPATVLFTKTNSVSLVPRCTLGKIEISPISKKK